LVANRWCPETFTFTVTSDYQSAFYELIRLPSPIQQKEIIMLTFLIWIVLFVFCWPLALLAIILYPVVWLILLPFRILGIAVEGVFELLRSIVLLPARILRGGR
jgi:hypothetical protein